MKQYYSLSEIKADISSGATNCVGLLNSYLSRIKEYNSLNTFVEVFEESALNKAKEVDEKIKKGTAGKLAGMVIGIKDNLCYKDHKVTASSKILEGFESLFTATAVERLLNEDAIIIGRLNCDEFAMGSSNETSVYGEVKNPLDTSKVPGGSSGGSAAAVKAGLCLAALGSDTGGSIRQPASFCDLVGMKPTYGRVSRYGLIAYASSFDQIGPLTHNVEDSAIIVEIISGKDDYDSTLSSKPTPNLSEQNNHQEKRRIAYFKSYVEHDGLDAEIREKIYDTIDKLKKDGHTVEELDFEYLEHLVPTYYVLTTAEASSNLARYDGIHFGQRSEKGIDIETTYKSTRTELFGKEVKRRIMLGTYVLSAGYYDAYYSKAQKVRRILKNKVSQIFKEYDFIITPTTPHTAFPINDPEKDAIKMYLEDIFTAQFNLTGNPAISLPMGQHSNGMPFGIQIVADNFNEKDLFGFSNYVMNNN